MIKYSEHLPMGGHLPRQPLKRLHINPIYNSFRYRRNYLHFCCKN